MSLLQNSNAISAGGAYNITDSLRFRSSASAYLTRTPTTAGNRKTFTISMWAKRGKLGTTSHVIFQQREDVNSSQQINIQFTSTDNIRILDQNGGSTVGDLLTNAVYRDTSAWYHIVIVRDSTNSTADDRTKLYVNGEEISSFSTRSNVSLNYSSSVNTTVRMLISGQRPNSSATLGNFYDGYMTEFNLVDGQALTASDFGETNADGVWSPIKYTGTYGTNGFYLNFSDGTSTTTLGYDYSGNSNNWTTNNVSLTAGATYDLMSDVPSLADEDTANFATLNPLHGGTASFAKNGNLTYYSNTSTLYSVMGCSIAVSSGKWYWELKCISGAVPTVTGILGSSVSTSSLNTYLAVFSTGYTYISNGYKGNNNVQVPYADTFTYGDTIGVALDLDNGAIYFSKNGVWQNSGDPTSGATATGAAYTGLSGEFVPAVSDHGAAGITEGDINFGQRPFAYTPPTGYKKLNTFNLPDSSITDGSQYMNTVLYTGNGTSQDITGVGFTPDLVWHKGRSVAYSHSVVDSVRGDSNVMFTNATSAEQNPGDQLDIITDGFTTTYRSANLANNQSGATYVAWNWRGSDSSAVSNTDGTITSTVSANTDSGFSIVGYTGISGTGTIGHGLSQTPEFIICKVRSTTDSWAVYHSSAGDGYLFLDSTAAFSSSAGYWGTPDSTTFGVAGTGTRSNNRTGQTHIAYCFHSVDGFSKFGSYTGNGSSDGPFVYTGFRPAFVLIKSSSAAEQWDIHDTSRDTYNAAKYWLAPNSSSAEGTIDPTLDILSNGFKLRYNSSPWNLNSGTYIYMAFAENPFKQSLAR